MSTDRRDLGDVTVLVLDGVVNGGEASRRLLASVERVLSEGRQKLILDMGKVSWVNSSGLGTLHRCWAMVKNSGGSFKLTHLNHRVRQILNVSHFDELFESYDDIRGAVASFYR